MAGPLAGVRIIELQGRGPGPFAAMMLADLGADVIRVARADDVRDGGGASGGGASGGGASAAGASGGADENAMQRMINGHRRLDLVARGRRSIAVDLKHPDGVAAMLRLVDGADVLLEGFRPGVAERLGLGPEDCQARNPRLVYARISGWGREGPYASTPAMTSTTSRWRARSTRCAGTGSRPRRRSTCSATTAAAACSSSWASSAPWSSGRCPAAARWSTPR